MTTIVTYPAGYETFIPNMIKDIKRHGFVPYHQLSMDEFKKQMKEVGKEPKKVLWNIDWKEDEEYRIISEHPLTVIVNPKYSNMSLPECNYGSGRKIRTRITEKTSSKDSV